MISGGKVEDFDFESLSKKPLRGNIYLARVTRVEPSLQAAFVEYGGNRHGFLAFTEIHSDYYQIPISDREALRDAEEREADLASKLTALTGDEISDDTPDEDDDGILSNPVSEATDDTNEAAETEEDGTGEIEQASEDAEQSDENSVEEDQETSELEATDPTDENVAEVTEGDEASETENAALLLHDALSAREVSAELSEASETDEDEDEDAEVEDEDAPSDDAIETVSEDGDDDSEEDEVEVKSRGGNGKSEAKERAHLEQEYQQARRDRIKLLKNYRIQEVIKRRQILLIQVVKEERGNKGAAVTTYLSLAGRYGVLMPNTARGGGISRKISNGADRKRLRKAMNELSIPQGMGLIIRTAGAKRTKSEIKRDFDYLLRLWENIRDLTMKSIAPCLVYEEASLIKRAIRDLYDKEISQVLVEGEAGYREAKDFMKMLMPSHAKNVQPYKDQVPLFINYKVEPQLDEMYQPVVKLKSGGYLVIQQTEALISVDVNSGKATKERNIEATALRTNLEAATEVARQCRLRDLAGLLVIDFIDMEENRNNRSVEKRLKDAMKPDRARIQFGRISNFGLLEMSRQRRRSGIVDGTTSLCPTCNGAGAVRSEEMAALRILRSIEEQAINGRAGIISAATSTEVALFVLNHKRDWLNRIETTYALNVEIVADPQKAGDQFEIEKRGPARDMDKPIAFVTADLAEIAEVPEENHASTDEETATDEKPNRKRRRRRRRKNNNGEENSASEQEATSEEDTSEGQAEKSAFGSDEEDGGRKRRRRGRRGGKRNRRKSSDEASDTPAEDAQEAASQTDPDTSDPAPNEGADNKDNTSPPQTDGAGEDNTSPTTEHKMKETVSDDGASVTDAIETVEKPDEGRADSVPTAANDPAEVDTTETQSESVTDVNRPKKTGWWSKALGRS
ncbi:MAG: Rne/Rng family ribonuclease [Aquisalinus sp.]|nr:Rne/Rng family ribonuclease [Aquisalinus sp.]